MSFIPRTVWRDPAGRWLMWGWVPETRSRDQYAAAGWDSCLILSREISLDNDSSLIVKHAIERQGLQTVSLFDSDGSMTAESSVSLGGVTCDRLEISCRVTAANCKKDRGITPQYSICWR